MKLINNFFKQTATTLTLLTCLTLASTAIAGCSPSDDSYNSKVVITPEDLAAYNSSNESAEAVTTEDSTTSESPAPTTQATDERAKNVMVVINTASADSREIGAYYRAKRKIPKENVALISCSTTENVPKGEYENAILAPIRKAIQASPNRIDFIVTTKGVPLRLDNNNGYSVDAFLGAMNLSVTAIREPKPEQVRESLNPYYNQKESFNSSKFKMYLVTRLTGYTKEDAKKLVDNSLAAKPKQGPFFFDAAPNRKSGGYLQMQNLLTEAHKVLTAKGYDSQLDETQEFMLPPLPLMGYTSWGSNDSSFSLDTYKKIKFLPGAIVETYVSTSGRTFYPTSGGQSLIADLIANGVTGVKGYVSEPYTFALAQPNILFDRYTDGYNLAESFYMASVVVKWKDIVIGDPLCNPYTK